MIEYFSRVKWFVIIAIVLGIASILITFLISPSHGLVLAVLGLVSTFLARINDTE